MIPASVPSGLASLLASVNAAYPLATATIFQLAAMQQQANTLIFTIDGALAADDSTIAAPSFVDPLSFAAALSSLEATAQEETLLAEIAALAGRAFVNIANAGV